MSSVADGAQPASLTHALDSLETASETPPKQRAVKITAVVDTVCSHAYEVGLDGDALRRVVYLVSHKNQLDQSSVTTLIKNLYPSQRVPADVIITVVGALGQGKGKPSPASQNALVKWLVTVHGITDDPNVLPRLYGVLFGMLDTFSIRTPLCHLLSLITRRKHVKPFRIQQLLEYSRSLGNEPALQGLLRVYKDYYPDIILGTTSTSRTSFPPRPDAEWRARLLAIQERAATASESLEQLNGFKVLRKGPKRTKPSLIPEVHTYHANEASVTLEGIDNAQTFVEKLDLIEPPGQLISFLHDPLLQKYVELKPSPIISRRIEHWLAACLEEQYDAAKMGTVDDQLLDEMLGGLLKHAHYTKSLLPNVLDFIKAFLPFWDGADHAETILGLLSYLPLQPFGELYANLLQQVEQSLLAARHGIEPYQHLLSFYASLFRHWAAQTPRRQLEPHNPEKQPTRVLDYPDQLALYSLAAHVDELSTSLLLSLTHPNATLTSSILTFYEVVTSSSSPGRVPLILPRTPLLYLLATTPSTSTITRTPALLSALKSAIDAHPQPLRAYYPAALPDFNPTVRDLHHLLWASKALAVQPSPEEPPPPPDKAPSACPGLYCAPALRSALNAYLASLEREYIIDAAFNLSHNPLLASLSAAAWRALEEQEVRRNDYDRAAVAWHQGPVSRKSLELLFRNGGVSVKWEPYRVFVVQWLAERGLGGLKAFAFAVSKDLREKYKGGGVVGELVAA